jgi:hypothetical protein
MIFLAQNQATNNRGNGALVWLCTVRRIRDPVVDHNLVLTINR